MQTPRRLSLQELGEVHGPGFISWFNASKVKDRQHRPLLCLHGTVGRHRGAHPLMHFGTPHAAHERLRLESSDPDMIEQPDLLPYLTQLRDRTSERRRLRAGMRYSRVYHVYPDGANLLIAYLHIRRPLDLDADPTAIGLHSSTPSISGLEDDHLGLCLSLGMTEAAMRAGLRRHGTGEALVCAALTESGFDGVRYPNQFEDYGRRSWIIREPSQVWFLNRVENPESRDIS